MAGAYPKNSDCPPIVADPDSTGRFRRTAGPKDYFLFFRILHWTIF